MYIILSFILLRQVLADLVQGEFMQLGARENEEERFTHYTNKTFKKTASLIAYSCQAVINTKIMIRNIVMIYNFYFYIFRLQSYQAPTHIYKRWPSNLAVS